MKKLVLLFTGLLMGLTTVTAAEKSSATQGEDFTITTRYRFTEPILFVERGVEFLIFPDGSFDFNTDFSNSQTSNYYYRRSNSRRGSFNTTYGAPGTVSRIHYSTSIPRGIIVTHDTYGRVRRVGNVFVNYDREGRVKRLGSVYIRYRHGLLKQVGGLQIQYNRRGDMIGTTGFVNYNNQGCGICGIGSCTTNHFDNDYGNDWDDDDDFYYYRKNGKTKKHKKHKRNKRFKH